MSGIRIVIFDELYPTSSFTPSDIESYGQRRLDAWLGVGKVKFEVAQLSDRTFKFTLWRTYGSWYDDPKRFSNCNETINSWDMNIFLADGYQTGTYADFSTHPGPYILSYGVQENFLRDLRAMAKKHHGTRIKAIDVDNNLDHVVLTITY